MTPASQAKDVLDHPEVDRLIRLALDEDGVDHDLTTEACGPLGHRRATIVAKSPTVSAGYPLIDRILRQANLVERVRASALRAEGSSLAASSPWVILEGPAADLLRIERVALNALMRACGIASYAAAVVKAVEGTACRVLHTRKTAPGHRRTDIYAALVGGAHPHRRSLDDAILVKENHLRAVVSFQELIDGVGRLRGRARFVEFEVSDFTELKHAMAARPDRILLDNFAPSDVERAVSLFGSSVELEASGSITLENARAYAETGVDFISMGAITHSAPAANISMLFDHER